MLKAGDWQDNHRRNTELTVNRARTSRDKDYQREQEETHTLTLGSESTRDTRPVNISKRSARVHECGSSMRRDWQSSNMNSPKLSPQIPQTRDQRRAPCSRRRRGWAVLSLPRPSVRQVAGRAEECERLVLAAQGIRQCVGERFNVIAISFDCDSPWGNGVIGGGRARGVKGAIGFGCCWKLAVDVHVA